MTKAEQARLVAWRLRILQHAASEHRHIAQQTSSKPDGDAAIYADYHSTTMTLRQQHMQALAEIDERYAEARRRYGEENIRRAQ